MPLRLFMMAYSPNLSSSHHPLLTLLQPMCPSLGYLSTLSSLLPQDLCTSHFLSVPSPPDLCSSFYSGNCSAIASSRGLPRPLFLKQLYSVTLFAFISLKFTYYCLMLHYTFLIAYLELCFIYCCFPGAWYRV